MIVPQNYWWPILEAKALPRGKVLGIMRLGVRLALWRDSQGQLHCLEDRCAHRGATLTSPPDFPKSIKGIDKYCAEAMQKPYKDRVGRLENDLVKCPYHGLTYDGQGACKSIPFAAATQPRIPKGLKIRSFHVCEAHGLVYLWWGDRASASDEVPWFNYVPDAGKMATVALTIPGWNYQRGIEQILDTAHFPSLHERAAKKFNLGGPILSRFETHEQDSRIFVDMELSHRDGRKNILTLKQEMIFPHSVCSSFTPRKKSQKIRIYFIAQQVPVSDDTVILFLRYAYDCSPAFLARTISRILLRLETSTVTSDDIRAVTSQGLQDGFDRNVLLDADKAYLFFERRWRRETSSREL